MNVDVAFIAEGINPKRLQGKRAILIDIIRATTTIVTAFQNGCLSVIPCLTPEEAFEKARKFLKGECLIGGARNGVKVPGFDLGNSPREYTREVIQGKHLVLSTTNGTRALRALSPAKEVAIGAFLNASAVSRWAAGQGSDLLIACAGLRGSFSLEDAVCAGLVVERLSEAVGKEIKKTDSAKACQILYWHYKGNFLGMLRESEWGRELEGRGLIEDLRYCSRVDIASIVPRMQEGRITL